MENWNENEITADIGVHNFQKPAEERTFRILGYKRPNGKKYLRIEADTIELVGNTYFNGDTNYFKNGILSKGEILSEKPVFITRRRHSLGSNILSVWFR